MPTDGFSVTPPTAQALTTAAAPPSRRTIIDLTRSKAGEGRLVGLEILRFASAIAVLIWHYQHFWYVGTTPGSFDRSEQPLYWLFKPFYEGGFYGVQAFWLLSGYIFFWKYRRPIAQRTIGGRRFFVMRFSRLYPLHFLTFIAMALLQFLTLQRTGDFWVYEHNGVVDAIKQLFMASYWAPGAVESFNGPIWSVSIEVLVYVTFYFIVRHLGPSPWVALAVAIPCGLAYTFVTEWRYLQCVFCFFLGGVTAIAVERLRDAPRLERALALLGIGFLIALPSAVFSLGLQHNGVVLQVMVLAMTIVAMFLLARYVNPSGRAHALCAAAGSITYSSYLIHVPLQLITVNAAAMAGWTIPRGDAWFLVGYLGVILGLGLVVFRRLEMPAQTLLRRRLA